jgi:endonuclease/exonuclease/phosphatase family metal-dependent hydrolase
MNARAVAGVLLVAAALFGEIDAGAAETFSVATFNLENYLEAPRGTRPAKSAAAKAKVRESLLAVRADVVALQEIGDTPALLELLGALRQDGLDYPHWEAVGGHDTNIIIAVASRFPILARRPHTNENFLLQGRRFQVSRGFAEVDLRVNPRYSLTLISAHLKSRRVLPAADEAELRLQEALLLRQTVEACLAREPDSNLIVLGDFNDTKASRTLRTLLGRGARALVDTRPAERNGDGFPAPHDTRNVTWTYYYAREDTYDRSDYILLSRSMAREWRPEGTFVLALPNWGLASDHRPVVAAFVAEDR